MPPFRENTLLEWNDLERCFFATNKINQAGHIHHKDMASVGKRQTSSIILLFN